MTVHLCRSVTYASTSQTISVISVLMSRCCIAVVIKMGFMAVLTMFYNPLFILSIFFLCYTIYNLHTTAKLVKQFRYVLQLNTSALRKCNSIFFSIHIERISVWICCDRKVSADRVPSNQNAGICLLWDIKYINLI